MPRTCTICTHAERSAIEAAIVFGTPYRHIASQYSVGYKSVERHATDHISQAIKQSQEAKEEAQALDVVQQLKIINGITLTILKEARTNKTTHGLALQAIDRIQRQIELQAKLLGDLDDRAQINILVTPEWQAIRSTMLQALLPYPDAKIAVAHALMQLEGHDRLN